MRKHVIVNSMSQQISISGDVDVEELREQLVLAATTGEVVTTRGVSGNSLLSEVVLHLRPSRWDWWALTETREEDIIYDR